MKKIIVTGSSGFVGKRFLEYNNNKFQLETLNLRDGKIDQADLNGADAVLHLAGKAHQMEPIADEIYFEVNYKLTKQLADKAKKNGVQLFVYASSVKVYGDEVSDVLDESSKCTPTDPYGASKLKAEQYLQSIETDAFKVAIVRPPLVYGPDVKGNMIRLLELAAKPVPLPFGKINNARSMVFVDNLVELMNAIIEKKARGIFIAGDITPVSTTYLLTQMRASLRNKKKLISIPTWLRAMIKRLRPSMYIRLFGSFVVNNNNTNQRLGFVPPYSTEYGIAEMVEWFSNVHTEEINN